MVFREWVNEEKTLGITDRPLSWNTPSKYAQELYRETKTIHELYGGRKRQKLTHDFRPSEEKLNRQIARMKKHGLQVCGGGGGLVIVHNQDMSPFPQAALQ